MNIYRSAVSACVIMGLPNVLDYIHKHRERLMEEKRQKLLALETQRQIDANNNNALMPNAVNRHPAINAVNNNDANNDDEERNQ